MKKYKVRIKKSYEQEIEVEANDLDEAEEKATDLFDNQEISGYEMLLEESITEELED